MRTQICLHHMKHDYSYYLHQSIGDYILKLSVSCKFLKDIYEILENLNKYFNSKLQLPKQIVIICN